MIGTFIEEIWTFWCKLREHFLFLDADFENIYSL